jgi:DNA polymerase III subunit gamma/tau
VVPAAADARDVAGADAARAKEMAGRLSIPVLARTWQMLLKGLDELQSAPSPLLAAEMLLVRLAYVADLPPPSELAALLDGRGATAGPTATAAATPRPAPAEVGPAELITPVEDAIVAPGLMEPPAAEAPIPPQPQTFADAVALFRRHDRPRLHSWLHDHVRVVQFEPGQIAIERAEQAPPAWHQEVAQCLSQWTGMPWRVRAVDQPGAPTLAELAAAEQQARIDALAVDPRIKPILERFPGAKIVDVRKAAPAP